MNKEIAEIATRMTEERFGEETYEGGRFPNEQEYLAFTDKAQDFYNEIYNKKIKLWKRKL